MQNLPTGDKGHGPIAADKYERFLQQKNPDRVCHVCGHDQFGIVTWENNAVRLHFNAMESSVNDRGLFVECLAHFCKKCGTMTFTAAHLVAEFEDDPVSS